MRQKPYAKLKLQINDAKSAVASAYERDYLSYEVCVGKGRELKYAVGNKALDNFMTRIRRLTRRREGRSMEQVVDRFRAHFLGWKTYFWLAQTPKTCPPTNTHPPAPDFEMDQRIN